MGGSIPFIWMSTGVSFRVDPEYKSFFLTKRMGGSTECRSIEEGGSWVRGEVATGGRDHQACVSERQSHKVLSSIRICDFLGVAGR